MRDFVPAFIFIALLYLIILEVGTKTKETCWSTDFYCRLTWNVFERRSVGMVYKVIEHTAYPIPNKIPDHLNYDDWLI